MRGGGWMRWAVLAVAAIAFAILLGWLAQSVGGLSERDERVRLVYGILLLTMLVGAVVIRWRRRPRLALGHLLGWVVIALVLLVGYSYRYELRRIEDRLIGEIAPSMGIQAGTQSVQFAAGDDGHFRVDGKVNDSTVRFIVDTGASVVVLTPNDARRIGLDPGALDYSIRFNTANGTGHGAPVVLSEIRIGPIRIANVRAAVNKTPMPASLLGQSFLDRLSGYRVSEGKLTLEK